MRNNWILCKKTKNQKQNKLRNEYKTESTQAGSLCFVKKKKFDEMNKENGDKTVTRH